MPHWGVGVTMAIAFIESGVAYARGQRVSCARCDDSAGIIGHETSSPWWARNPRRLQGSGLCLVFLATSGTSKSGTTLRFTSSRASK